MRKNIVFFGLSVLLAGFLLFVLRLINSLWINNSMNLLIIFSSLALVLLIFGMVKRMNKPLLFSALGVFIVGLLSFLLRMVRLEDNLIIFIINLLWGIILLLYGVIKR